LLPYCLALALLVHLILVVNLLHLLIVACAVLLLQIAVGVGTFAGLVPVCVTVVWFALWFGCIGSVAPRSIVLQHLARQDIRVGSCVTRIVKGN